MVIKSYEGEIDEAKLDDMIEECRSKWNITESLEDIRDLVIEDYEESDISQVTLQDIIEICDSSS